MKPSEILRAAKRLIDEPGKWYQGDYCSDDRNAFCSIGAIRRAAGVSPDETKVAGDDFLVVAIGGYAPMDIPSWNDSKDRTHADVMAAFDRAIALAEKDELPKREREGDDAYCKRVLSEIIAAPVAEGVRV